LVIEKTLRLHSDLSPFCCGFSDIREHLLNQEIPFIAALVLTISTQVLGYGWAGLLRKYLVVCCQLFLLSSWNGYTQLQKDKLIIYTNVTCNRKLSKIETLMHDRYGP
jgi:hypothetical protein